MNYLSFIGQWISENQGKATGVILGFSLGILIFTLGLMKTLFVVLLVLIGYIIGKSRDDNVSVIDEITGLFRKRKGDDMDEE